MEKVCVYCKRALGCPLLYGRDGRFDPTRLFTDDSSRECPKFEEVGVRERNVREWGYKRFGLGYLRVLHELPEVVMEGLRQGEKDELMYDSRPNFSDPSLLWEGMTTVEREDVLRHQTDENGQIIIEIDSEGVEHKLARPEYHLKAYMCDPDGPIKIDRGLTWTWNTNQVVDQILKAEVAAGLIVKAKKTKAASEETEEATTEESETSMAVGRVVRTVRTSPNKPAAPAPQSAAPQATVAAPRAQARPKPPTGGTTGRVANPPGRRPAAPAQAAQATAPAATQAAAAAPGLTIEDVKKAVLEVMGPMIEKAKGELKQTTIECATILNDIAGQTDGRFQVPKIDEEGNLMVDEAGNYLMECNKLFQHPSKIYAYMEGTAYEPEYMSTPGGVTEDEAPAEEVQEGEEG